MPHLALGRLRSVLDLSKQLRFDPDAFVRNPLGIGLCLPNQRLEAPPQLGRRCLVEAVVDLAGIDEVVALAPREINAVPFAIIEREAGNPQRLGRTSS